MKKKLRAGRAKPGKVKWMGRERKKKGKRTMGNRRGKRIDGRAQEGQKTLKLRTIGEWSGNRNEANRMGNLMDI